MHKIQAKHLWSISLGITILCSGGCSRKQAEGDSSGINDSGSPSDTTSTRKDEATDASGNGATGNEQSSEPNNSSPNSTNTQENTTNSSTNTTDDAGATESSATTSTTTSTFSGETNAQGQILCGSKVWACGDGLDNDNDGKVDLDDPECISPCDDTEGTFATALPGQNSDCKSDCYFDADSGSGNDKCDFNLKCDPLSPAANIGCAYDSAITSCEATVPQTCLDTCVPLVPNGCDCFGCCEVKTSTGSQFIYLGSSSSCNLENLDQCGSCTFNSQCSNSCERDDCELCFGDETLPAHCTQSTCPTGVQSCKTSTECPSGTYCLTGCCAFVPG